jgi:RNA polymerase sigma-54 factor
VLVEQVDGRYEVRLTRGRIPELQVSPSYRQLLKGTQRGDAVQQWVKRRIESARWFVDAVHQRQNTMLKIAQVIFDHQRDFLDKGVRALRPLRMQEVADRAGVHISTVSRAVAGKYSQTPQGIHPLKYFFTGGTAVETGGVASQESVKQRIVEMVQAEDGKHPLSDDQLADALHAQHGIRIARRTVTKYRKALGIPSSSQRKQF